MGKIGFWIKWKKCIIIEHLKINIIAAGTENFERNSVQQIYIRNIVGKKSFKNVSYEKSSNNKQTMFCLSNKGVFYESNGSIAFIHQKSSYLIQHSQSLNIQFVSIQTETF